MERAAKRQLEDWQSRRWVDAWTAVFAARRTETLGCHSTAVVEPLDEYPPN